MQDRLPDLLALYAFGSRIQGQANADSDLDLAVLVAGYADPLLLFDLAGELADVAGCAVDLLDLRAALFEAAILSEKTALDEARNALINDIQHRGSVYGR